MFAMPVNPTTHRKEILTKFFDYIQGAESFYLVGAASMGKTRLLDFLSLPQTKTYYIKDENESNKTLIIRVDLNRQIPNGDPIYNFFELMLSSLLLEFSKQQNEEASTIFLELTNLETEVIKSNEPLMAIRFLELEISKLCQIHSYKLCFFFDEFDEALRTAPREIFAILRAMRDANKLNLIYALSLRNLPEKPHIRTEIESFYELVSRNPLGIGPYTREDTLGIIRKLEERLKHSLPYEVHEWLATTSGGHVGLVQALLKILIDKPDAANHLNDISWFANHEMVTEECRKIWGGLMKDEQAGLKAITQGTTELPYLTQKTLHLKGLIKYETNTFFSSLFEWYVKGL